MAPAGQIKQQGMCSGVESCGVVAHPRKTFRRVDKLTIGDTRIYYALGLRG